MKTFPNGTRPASCPATSSPSRPQRFLLGAAVAGALLWFPQAASARDARPQGEAAALQLAAAYSAPHAMIGIASWYGGPHAGRRTASGEIHSTTLRTAAHPNLAFGTLLKVTNLRNGKTSVVRVNDRGPFAKGRMIDLSEQAARDLAMTTGGLARVRLEILRRD